MTNTTTNKEYERIEWDEVREGDHLIHWNGDRLTVTETFPERLRAAGIDRLNERWEQGGFFPYGKVEPLPTTPGAYLDKDGAVWELVGPGPWPWECGGDTKSAREAAVCAPFTRLVPMPTEEQVTTALCTALRHTGDLECEYDHEATDAVMALLGGGDNE